MFCLSENEKTSSTSAFSGTTSKCSAEKRKGRAYTSGIRIHWSCDYCLKFAQSSKDLIKRLTDQAKDQDQDGSSSSWFAMLSRKTIEWFFLTRGVSLSALSSLESPIDLAVNLVWFKSDLPRICWVVLSLFGTKLFFLIIPLRPCQDSSVNPSSPTNKMCKPWSFL